MSITPEDEAKKIIDENRTFLITSHVYLDGDAAGCELALMLALESAGKRAVVINADPVPLKYRFLPGADRIRIYPDGADEKFDAAFVLDAGVLKRTRKVQDLLTGGMPVVNIDHHVSNSEFGTVNILDFKVSSAAEIILGLLKGWGFEITPDIATNLYTGVMTDTGKFSFSNTTANTFRVAAELVDAGANPNLVFTKVFQEQVPGQIKLLERALGSLNISPNGRWAWIELTDRDFEETGTAPMDTESFAEIPRSVKGVEAAFFLRKEGEKNVKGSLRSNGAFNASAFAAAFDGGGHHQAAGFTLREDWETARRRVLRELEDHFDKYVE